MYTHTVLLISYHPHVIPEYGDMTWLNLSIRIVSPQLAARCSSYASWLPRDFLVAFIWVNSW